MLLAIIRLLITKNLLRLQRIVHVYLTYLRHDTDSRVSSLFGCSNLTTRALIIQIWTANTWRDHVVVVFHDIILMILMVCRLVISIRSLVHHVRVDVIHCIVLDTDRYIVVVILSTLLSGIYPERSVC